MKRVCIYPKDASILTGKSVRYCRQLLQLIREVNNKSKDQFVTVIEFADYTGIDLEIVQKICI